MLTEKQLQMRALGIGGSDAAAACGLDEYSTPLELYIQKVTPEAAPPKSSPALLWGNILEAPIRQHFGELHGFDIDVPVTTFFHKKHSFALCHPDGLIGTDAIFEAKNSRYGIGYGMPGSDEVPDHCFLQVQHNLAVTDRVLAYVAVLVSGQDFRQYVIRADPETQERLFKIEYDFWQHVVERRPPQPGLRDWDKPETRALIARVKNLTEGKLVLASGDQERWMSVYREATEIAKVHSSAARAALAHLAWEMDDAAEMEFSDQSRLRRSLVRKRAFSVAATEFWQHRIVNKGKAGTESTEQEPTYSIEE